MATPTQMKHAASQQGRTPSQLTAATPPVSTPFSASQAHIAFSPRGPKSSPQQFKKSPATSTTLMGHPANGALNFDSPSAAAAMGALGISGGLDMGLDHAGIAGFGGLGALGSEDDKLKRFDAVIEILGKATGRVSEAGLERLTLRTGLTSMWDEHRSPDGRKTRMLVIAGQALTIDIELNNNIVENVSLGFPESGPIVTRHKDQAGNILLKDLQLRPDQSPLTKTLKAFSANLERLATLDKLSVVPGFDCQEALAGIFESLERLHKWELSKLREDPAMSGKPERFLETTVMCTKSGRPRMHSRGMVGLSIEYWTERRHVIPKAPETTRYCENMEKAWSILIGCKALDGDMFPPVRVSEDWISQKVEKTEPGPEDLLVAASGPALDWLEPEPTTLPQTDDNKDSGIDVVQADGTTHKYPNVKFVATLTPSVIVPQSVWNTLHTLTGAQAQPMPLPTYTFDSISFPIPEGSHHDASELRVISCERRVPIPSDDNAVSSRKHKNTLLIYKPVYGQTVTELSFSHPRQLVAMLPILRQYALISTLLERSFSSDISGETLPEVHENITMSDTRTTQAEYERFMSKNYDGDEQELTLDVVLTVHPSAGLHIVFPFRNATANVDLQIQHNGVVHVVSQNIVPVDGSDAAETGKGKGKQLTPQDLGRLLEVMEDLCSWAEWIRKNLS
ncbi:hypothetical protein CORC01_13508 [Colletotrichum orchidophilum]|uniref:Mediator of RNA polymerase II transcription subunit 1 n=1 Tax=Colletotrichum orchidophilum TaxID=1209926 RepID=A0A1G4APV1_9PEZI|nr:uncharacterized protein CORC01_13508 [Colletotrichum orchidophilum]OHE91197.1 hypothetical protein CORC01_13508 [Colletotrichum orchidophilum]